MEVTLSLRENEPIIRIGETECRRLSRDLFSWFLLRGPAPFQESCCVGREGFQFKLLKEGGEEECIGWRSFLRLLASYDPHCPAIVKAHIQGAGDCGTVRLWLTYADGAEGPLFIGVAMARMLIRAWRRPDSREDYCIPLWRASEQWEVTRWVRLSRSATLYGVEGQPIRLCLVSQPIVAAYAVTTFEVAKVRSFWHVRGKGAGITLHTDHGHYPLSMSPHTLFRKLSRVRDGLPAIFRIAQQIPKEYVAPDQTALLAPYDVVWNFRMMPPDNKERVEKWLHKLLPAVSPQMAALPVGAFQRRSFVISEIMVVGRKEALFDLRAYALGEDLRGDSVAIEAPLKVSGSTITSLYSQSRILYQHKLPCGVRIWLEIDKEKTMWGGEYGAELPFKEDLGPILEEAGALFRKGDDLEVLS